MTPIEGETKMSLRAFPLAASLAVLALIPGVASAQSAPPSSATPAFREAIPNIPGKSIIAGVVSSPPGGKSLPHHHARSAFITGYVLAGAIRSQVDDGPVQVFQ